MSANDPVFWSAVESETHTRLEALRQYSPNQLALQGETTAESGTVLGKQVTFTTFRESIPGGQLMVVVQASIPAFLGLGWKGTELGFVIEPSGQVRNATSKELGYVL